MSHSPVSSSFFRASPVPQEPATSQEEPEEELHITSNSSNNNNNHSRRPGLSSSRSRTSTSASVSSSASQNQSRSQSQSQQSGSRSATPSRMTSFHSSSQVHPGSASGPSSPSSVSLKSSKCISKESSYVVCCRTDGIASKRRVFLQTRGQRQPVILFSRSCVPFGALEYLCLVLTQSHAGHDRGQGLQET